MCAVDEPASPTGVMLSAAMEIMEGMASLRQAALGYKASLIEDGWNEAQAERIAAELLIELNRKVLRI